MSAANPAQGFRRHVNTLQALVWFQRSLRLALRAAWLGLSGYLMAWCFSALTGLLNETRFWWLIGLLFGIIPLVRLGFAWPPLHRLVWSVDRKMGLKEQVSTALAVLDESQQGALAAGLVEDAGALLPGVQRRVLRRGWFIGRDLLSLVIVGALAVAVNLNASLSFPAAAPETIQVAALPALPGEPSLAEVVPGNVPGLAPTDAQKAGQPNKNTSQSGMSAANIQSMSDALQKIGAPLSGQAETKPLADALQALDLKQAAAEMQKLANQANTLSQPAKDQLAQAMQSAAPALDQAGLKGLAADLQASATTLKDPSGTTPLKDNLNKTAGDLSALAAELAGQSPQGQQGNTPGQGAGSGVAGEIPQKGNPIAARLGGEGNNFEIPNGASAQSGLLVAGAPSGSPVGTASGALDLSGAGGDTVTSLLEPYYYPWIYQNVVSRYFQPQQ